MADLEPMYGFRDPRTKIQHPNTPWELWRAHRYVLRHHPDDEVMAMLFDPPRPAVLQ
jgi:hypothetical protein